MSLLGFAQAGPVNTVELWGKGRGDELWTCPSGGEVFVSK